MSSGLNLRSIATRTLADVIQGQSLSSVLPKRAANLQAKDKAWLQEVCYGVCRQFFYLEYIQQQLLDKPLARRHQPLADLLLKVGLYQLAFMRIPDHAAINETVAATTTLKLANLKGLVNAVLRHYRRQQAEFDDLKPETYQWNHPAWLVEKLKHNWPNHWQHILEQNNQNPPMTIRVNVQHTDRENYLALLKEQGIDAIACPYARYGINLLNAVGVDQLPYFDQGWVSVQDEAAQLCADLLIPETTAQTLSVLDACAAPGGKTLSLLERHPTLNLTALEIDSIRAKRIEENLQRCDQSAEVIVSDVLDKETWWTGNHFDRILLDAPCSATGVIRRHPDIKLLRKETDIKPLSDLQLQMLTTLWDCLKPGGILLYATCSIFPQENSRIVERFLKQQGNAILQPLNLDWGIDTGFGYQCFPQAQGHDGFFYAKLSKSV